MSTATRDYMWADVDLRRSFLGLLATCDDPATGLAEMSESAGVRPDEVVPMALQAIAAELLDVQTSLAVESSLSAGLLGLNEGDLTHGDDEDPGITLWRKVALRTGQAIRKGAGVADLKQPKRPPA